MYIYKLSTELKIALDFFNYEFCLILSFLVKKKKKINISFKKKLELIYELITTSKNNNNKYYKIIHKLNM